MRARTLERLRDLGVEPPAFLDEQVRPPRTAVLVHGDLHARQLLVDDAGAISGVIDWGDVHHGDPACDLSVAHTLLPPPARAEFRAAYGPIDDDTWALARLRGLHLSAALGIYAKSLGDDALLDEALAGVELSRTG
jgi:aminoglycoside phosphotransferase (APT) family kinase protein